MAAETKVETDALKQAADALVRLRADTERAEKDPIDGRSRRSRR